MTDDVSLVDELGRLDEAIAELESRAKPIRDRLGQNGAGALHGKEFKATISHDRSWIANKLAITPIIRTERLTPPQAPPLRGNPPG